MNKRISKFLEFNGKTLVFLAVDGEYWVALKPICEALNVDYSRQLRTLKADPIFSQLWSLQTMVGADNKARKMVSLPEKWIYGWLMSLQSASAELIEYKKMCYEILNDYFHGTITGRKNLLSEKAKAQLQINAAYNSLDPETTLKLKQANSVVNKINIQLRKLDGDILEEERTLFSQ